MTIEVASHSHPWSRKNFEDSIAHEAYSCQLLLHDGEIAGYTIACKGFEELHLLNITVAPAYRGQKLGVLLLKQLCLWGQMQGLYTLWLEVRRSNAPAQKLYSNFGMVQVGVRKDYYPLHEGGREDAFILRYDIAPAA